MDLEGCGLNSRASGMFRYIYICIIYWIWYQPSPHSNTHTSLPPTPLPRQTLSFPGTPSRTPSPWINFRWMPTLDLLMLAFTYLIAVNFFFLLYVSTLLTSRHHFIAFFQLKFLVHGFFICWYDWLFNLLKNSWFQQEYKHQNNFLFILLGEDNNSCVLMVSRVLLSPVKKKFNISFWSRFTVHSYVKYSKWVVQNWPEQLEALGYKWLNCQKGNT